MGILVLNCPHLPTIVIMLQRNSLYKRAQQATNVHNCRRLCTSCRALKSGKPHLDFPHLDISYIFCSGGGERGWCPSRWPGGSFLIEMRRIEIRLGGARRVSGVSFGFRFRYMRFLKHGLGLPQTCVYAHVC